MPEGGNAGKLEGSPAQKPSHPLGKAEPGTTPHVPVPVFRAARISAQPTVIPVQFYHYTAFSCMARQPGDVSVAQLAVPRAEDLSRAIEVKNPRSGRLNQESDREVKAKTGPACPENFRGKTGWIPYGERVGAAKKVTVTFHRFLPTAKVTVTLFPAREREPPSPGLDYKWSSAARPWR